MNQIERNKKVIIEYLKTGCVFSRVDKYIIESGELFVGRKSSPQLIDLYEPKERQCYRNSQMLALKDDLHYFEGVALDGLVPIPIEHAWNVQDGRVIDLTWELLDSWHVESYDTVCVYYGVEIPREFMLNNMIKTEMAEQLIYKFCKNKFERDKETGTERNEQQKVQSRFDGSALRNIYEHT